MAFLDSLDPRINRLQVPQAWNNPLTKDTMDQFQTYEVFVRPKDGKPHEHVGIVHAPSIEMAFLFGKEQFSRRFTCTGMWVVNTQDVQVSPFTENKLNIYDLFEAEAPDGGEEKAFEIFHLYKRGKQHKHMGRVNAIDHEHAIAQAQEVYDDGKPVFNIWVMKSKDMFFFSEEDRDIWDTLSEKKYRDAIAYKAGAKLDNFKKARAAASA